MVNKNFDEAKLFTKDSSTCRRKSRQQPPKVAFFTSSLSYSVKIGNWGNPEKSGKAENWGEIGKSGKLRRNGKYSQVGICGM